MQWLMLQQASPEDFVIATGFQVTVREFIRRAAIKLGVDIEFSGEGVGEVGVVSRIDGELAPSMKIGDTVVRVDPRYYRPTEVETLLGDPSKAKESLGWVPEITLDEMIDEMIRSDLNVARQHALLRQHGFGSPVSRED
jgi:GDPmannose 4,6-dehydratase